MTTVEKMREALIWYAALLGHSESMDHRVIHQDRGQRAREALGIDNPGMSNAEWAKANGIKLSAATPPCSGS